MTILSQLFRKGLVTRTRQGRAYLYQSAVKRTEVHRALVIKLLEDYFHADLRLFLEVLDREFPESASSDRKEQSVGASEAATGDTTQVSYPRPTSGVFPWEEDDE